MIHLSDDTLNEFLDETLTPALRIEADTHLAACLHCAARLEALRVLCADLEALPDLPLSVDLTPSVLARLAQPTRLPRPLRWLALAQGLSALLALILAWPLLANLTASLEFPVLAPSWAEISARISSAWLDIASRLPIPTLQIPSLRLDLPAITFVLVLTSVSLLWLVGNACLLNPYSRRTP